METDSFYKTFVLFIESIEGYFPVDIAYYGLEIFTLVFYFWGQEVSEPLREFVMKWSRLLLIPTAVFPALSPIFYRFSKFRPTKIILPTPTYINPNQRTAILAIIAHQIYQKYPILAIVFILISVFFPIFTKKNSFLQVFLSFFIGIILSISYNLNPKLSSHTAITLSFLILFSSFLIQKPFDQENDISFLATLIGSIGLTLFDLFLHLNTISEGERLFLGFFSQFSFSYIAKYIEN